MKVQLNKPMQHLHVHMDNRLGEFDLKSCYWTTFCSKSKIRTWEIKTPNGRSGGKLCKGLLMSKYKRVWRLPMLMNRLTNLNCRPIKWHLHIPNMLLYFMYLLIHIPVHKQLGFQAQFWFHPSKPWCPRPLNDKMNNYQQQPNYLVPFKEDRTWHLHH